ncbi:MAG: histone-like nucleoid-structuring protein Lsr2 [Candidatus Nanopelagicales bacterium]|nr:histone-like nucleoid-structuring protein Lsr2 [Candidatus Nanopelagicales bacterium]
MLIALNPDPDSKLPYLLRLPIGAGLVFRVRDTWPRTAAVYCHPVPLTEWPEDPTLVEQQPLRSCQRRGPSIDVVLTRSRENRSQLVFTRARGRDVVFWQSPKTRKQSRPAVRVPTGRAPGADELTIIIDAHERYAYRFVDKPVLTTKRALPAGDYGAAVGDRLVAVAERKSAEDLIASLTNGRLRYALGELAAVPRAVVVVEDKYSAIFKQQRLRPSLVADGLAELQVRWPSVPIVFCETRPLAEEYVYRFLAAAVTWALDDSAVEERLGQVLLLETTAERAARPAAPGVAASNREVRAWALESGLAVSDRGRLPAGIIAAYRAAHP